MVRNIIHAQRAITWLGRAWRAGHGPVVKERVEIGIVRPVEVLRHVPHKRKGISKESLRVQRALKKQIAVVHKSDQRTHILSGSEPL